jgi:hypothetical protein
MSTVTVFSTRGNNRAVINNFEGTTWADLKPLVEAEGYNLGELSATESIGRTDLANDSAVLPTQDFVLFLRPNKMKAGSELEETGEGNINHTGIQANIPWTIEPSDNNGGDDVAVVANEYRLGDEIWSYNDGVESFVRNASEDDFTNIPDSEDELPEAPVVELTPEQQEALDREVKKDQYLNLLADAIETMNRAKQLLNDGHEGVNLGTVEAAVAMIKVIEDADYTDLEMFAVPEEVLSLQAEFDALAEGYN